MKYLDPKADLTFKKIFGNHPKRLISLLNALLPLSEEEQIHEIKYLPTELVPQLEGGKVCCIYSFLFTQTLWLPLPIEPIGEVRSAVISFSSREAAVRLRLLIEA